MIKLLEELMKWETNEFATIGRQKSKRNKWTVKLDNSDCNDKLTQEDMHLYKQEEMRWNFGFQESLLDGKNE